MAKDLVPQEPDERSVEDVPLATQRAYDAIMKRFSDMLQEHAVCNMKRRGSATPTDADIYDAFRQLTRPKSVSKAQRIAGDALMVFGGVMLPLYTTAWLLSLAGAGLVLAGLYIREYLPVD